MNDAPYLPHFSDPADIDEFVAVLGQFERGEIGPEKFRAFRLARGVYGQRQEGFQMLRVKLPLGALTCEQLDALARVADEFTPRGLAHLTTRQNVQFHFVKLERCEQALRILADVGITSREACGNTVRNITADPLSGICPGALFDVRPYGEAVVRHLLRADYDQSLPRKFKIAFSCCPHDCALAAINDLGFVAAERDGRRGFKVVCAGGLSTTPQNALVLHEFVPAEELLDVAESVVRLFDRTGNRENKHRARLKYVLRKLGADGFVTQYEAERAKVRANGGTPLTDKPAATEAVPAWVASRNATPAPTTRSPGYVAWRASNVIDQSQTGYAAVYVRLPMGDVSATQLRAVARLGRQFGDGSLRTTLDQNLLFRFVPVADLPALHAALVREGLDKAGAASIEDVTSCPGADSCNLAVTASKQLGIVIGAHLESLTGNSRRSLELARATTIKISGCPNSCGQHHIADLGFHGAVRRVGERSAPVYQLHLGGGVDARDGATFGRQIIKIPARRVPVAVERLIVMYANERVDEETPRQFFRRVTDEAVNAALHDLADIAPDAAADDFVDVGQEANFKVQVGAGECAA